MSSEIYHLGWVKIMKMILICLLVLYTGMGLFAQERIAVFPFEDLDEVFELGQSLVFYKDFSNKFAEMTVGRFSVFQLDSKEMERLISTVLHVQLKDVSDEKIEEIMHTQNVTQILSGTIVKLRNGIRIVVTLYSYPGLDTLGGTHAKIVANAEELSVIIPELVQDMQNTLASMDSGKKTSYEYRFTTAQKTKAGFKNVLFGLGSFQIDDPLGGGTTLALEAVTLGFFIYGAVRKSNARADAENETYLPFKVDHILSASEQEQYAKWKDDVALKEKEFEKIGELFLLTGGIGLALSWTWGFIRPFLYDKPVAVKKAANVIDHLYIGILPMDNREPQVSVLLNYRY
jgi:TolB-like protein